MNTWKRGPVEARWLGALWVRHAQGAVMIDAPAGIAQALADADLAALRCVVISTNRLRSMEGLPALCDAVARVRGPKAMLHLVHGLDAPRVAAIADAWTRGWPDSTSLAIDGVRSADPIELVGDIEVTLTSLTLAEVAPGGGIASVAGGAVHLHLDGATIVWVPAARPNGSHGHAGAGADLAVYEIGHAPWPRTEQPWRPTVSQAIQAGQSAGETWIVGDDGQVVGDQGVD